MTKEEIQAFNKTLLKIMNSAKRKFVPTDESENEFVAMVPLGEVLGHLRAFTNFIKEKDQKRNES